MLSLGLLISTGTSAAVSDSSRLDMADSIPACIRMHEILVKYSQEYGVPFKIAYGIAHRETGYNGPLHWKYNPRLRNRSAVGAMQIQLGTAKRVWNDNTLTSRTLMNDLEFNVKTAMKLMSTLKVNCGTWARALGCYNTGKPIVNRYAREILKGQHRS